MNNAKQEKHETGTTDFVHLYRSICDSPSIFQSGNKAPHKYSTKVNHYNFECNLRKNLYRILPLHPWKEHRSMWQATSQFRWLWIAFFGARGIGRSGESARVFKQNFYFDHVTKNKGFWLIWKRTLGAFQTVNFFDNWHIDRLFLSLAFRIISSNFTHTLL